MSDKSLPIEFQKAIPVIDRIEKNGFEAYFVGGCVRDLLLDKTIHDVDIATSAVPEEIKQLFPKTIDVGIEHGTILVLSGKESYEITTFRTESAYQDYRRPDKVTFVRSLEEDLKRRDFTMNALAMTKSGQLIDLFNGAFAIKQHKIIAVGNPTERFTEDALRMLRALRFSSQLNFEIENDTLQAIKENHLLLAKISVERICIEWEKMLLGPFRHKGLVPFIETNCYLCCPGFNNKKEALTKLLDTNEKIIIKNETIAWVIVCYTLQIKDAQTFLKEWKCSNKLIQNVIKSLIQLNNRETNEWSPIELYKSGRFIIETVEEARLVLNKSSHQQEALTQYDLLAIQSKSDLKINGKKILAVLKRPPGPWLGDLLNRLEKKVVLNEVANNEHDLIKVAKKLGGKPDERIH